MNVGNGILRAGLCAFLVLGSVACHKSGQDSQNESGIKGGSIGKWRTVEVVAGGKKYNVEVGRFAKPSDIKIPSIAQTRRDTPLGTWVSIQSYVANGQDRRDLEAYADHFVDSKDFLSRVTSPPQQYFDQLRKADDQPQPVGLIKYGQYVLVVSSVHHNYHAACMTRRGDKFCVDDKAQVSDPLLRQLSATDYKIMKND